MSKPFARQFYSSKAWQDCRNEYGAKRGWLCEKCLSRGQYVPGEEVHHIIKLTPQNVSDPAVALNFENLILLCRECHRAEHKEHKANSRYRIGERGEIIVTDIPPVV